MNTGRSKAYVSSRRYGTPRDNLTLDAIDAELAGMTYGKYKAQHPNTKEENEARLKEQPKRTQPRAHYVFYCRGCGEKFTTTNAKRIYCCDECKKTKDSERYRALRSKKTKKEEKKK